MQPKGSTLTLCECGCGHTAPLATRTNARLGLVKGKPRRFVHGHARRDPRPLAEHFADKIQPAEDLSPNGMSGCILWTGASRGTYYGGIRGELAHRVAWCLASGLQIPPDLQIDHLCRRKLCVNPEHLEVVTGLVNVRRASRASLTMERIGEIRALVADGWLRMDVAAAYGISGVHAGRIASGQSWA